MVTLVGSNANDAMVAPMVRCGGVCFCRESGVRRSVLCWCISHDSGGFIHREHVLTFNLLHKDFIIVVFSMRFVKIMLQ
jgi:hypothetical protein